MCRISSCIFDISSSQQVETVVRIRILLIFACTSLAATLFTMTVQIGQISISMPPQLVVEVVGVIIKLALCLVNSVVIIFLCFLLFFYPLYASLLILTHSYLVKEVLFYGASILCLISTLTSLLTYVDMHILYKSLFSFIL